MPFEKELQVVYKSGIKETLEDLGWTCNRSDEKFDTPEIVCTVCKNAQEASLILADLTGRNPNVFLEVGLAFGLEKYVVFLSQNPEHIPFDTKTFRTIMYDPNKLPDLRRRIHTLIKSIKVPPRMSKESIFESRCAKLKRIKEAPPIGGASFILFNFAHLLSNIDSLDILGGTLMLFMRVWILRLKSGSLLGSYIIVRNVFVSNGMCSGF